MLKELTDSQSLRMKLYDRLYEDLRFAASLEQALAMLPQYEQQSIVIGQKPDLKSMRHFTSLDTRAREIRNRKDKPENEIANLVIRKYQSSVGDEYFISYEDELGYLYGFTRLLLPKEEHIMNWE